MPRLTNRPANCHITMAISQAKVRYRGRDHYLGKWGSPGITQTYA
jgi:hypothetical protein